MAQNLDWSSVGTPVDSGAGDWSSVGTPVGDPKKQNKGMAGDVVTDFKRGIEQLPGIVTGLADIPIAAVTGEAYANKAANVLGEITGIQPSKWAKDAEAEYSPKRRVSRAAVDKAWQENASPFEDAAGGDFSGIGNIAKAYIENPQQLVGSVVESLPSMWGSAKAAQFAAKKLGIFAPGIAPFVGEGAAMGGQQMDQLSQTEADPRVSAGASALTGIVGGAMGALGGKVAQKLGIIDPDVAMAGGVTRAVADEAKDQTIKGAIKEGAKRVAGGAMSEGFFEELPQSVLEQTLSNLAQGKPWDEGVSRAAVEGTLAGSLMGGAFNVLPPSVQAPGQQPPADPNQNPLLALPAPTYTGTPGNQIVAADVERQAAIDKAQAEADALYAARDEYEREKRRGFPGGVPTITNDPAPIQQRIDALLGINQNRLAGIARSNYEKALEAAFNERIGFAVGKDSMEIPVTMGDYLASKVAAGDIDRNSELGRRVALRANAGMNAENRLQQLADEEAMQQPDIAPIPVVGPVSAAANVAVQTGVSAQVQLQQAAEAMAQQQEGKPAEHAPANINPLAQAAGITQGAPSVAVPEQVAQEAPQTNDAQAAPAQPAAFDVSKRTDTQLQYLTQHGQPGWKEAAVAELQKRGVEVSAPQQAKSDTLSAEKPANSATVPAQNTADSANRFDAKGLHPGTPEYNAAYQAWMDSRSQNREDSSKNRQREENQSAIDKKNKWRNKLRDWFNSAEDGDSITDVTGQRYVVVTKVRRDGTSTKTLIAVDDSGVPLPDGRAATGVAKIGDRLDGLNDGSLDVDTGSAHPESAGQSFASSLGQQLETGEAKTGKSKSNIQNGDGITSQAPVANVPDTQQATEQKTETPEPASDIQRDRNGYAKVGGYYVTPYEDKFVVRESSGTIHRVDGKQFGFASEQEAIDYAKGVSSKPTEGGPEDSIGWTRMTTAERTRLLVSAGYAGNGNRPLNLSGAGVLNRAWDGMGKGIREKLIAAHDAQFKPADQNPIKNENPSAATGPAETKAPEQDPIKNIDAAANEAATSAKNDTPQPTEAQQEAGNYKKGHITVQGLNITIENPEGSKRSGTDEDGKAWEATMAAHYGYIKRTKGNDGDHVDVYVGNDPESDIAFIVDQSNADGSFDEHKVLLGFANALSATRAYAKSYEPGWMASRVIAAEKLTVSELKEWLKNGDMSKPYSSNKADQPSAETVTAPEQSESGNQSEQVLDMVPAVDAVSQPKTDGATEAKQDKAPASNRFERKWPLSAAEAKAQGIIVSGYDTNRNATRWGVGDNWSSSDGNFSTAGEALDHYYQVTKPNDEVSARQQAESARIDALAEFKDKKAWPVFKDIEAGTIDYVDPSNGEIVTMTISAYRQQVFKLEEQFGTPSKSIGSMEDLRAVSSAIKQAKPTGAELLKARIEADKAKASDTDTRFAKNTIFTADKVAAAKARMKAKLGTMNSGIDPELLIDGMVVAGAYIESGVRKFADYAKAMVEDLGDGVKPYLLSFYEAARAYPGLNKMGMDSQEAAEAQHQAMLTPEVKAASKEVIGESPKVEKKKPENLGEAVRLKADWGVRNIDGYTKSKTGKNQETDYGLKGGIKDEFLNDAKRYLKAVSKLLEDQGFTVHLDKKGKGQAAVSANEAGPAVSGDVSLLMRRGNFGVYATVGVSAIRGVTPAHPQGVALMARTTQDADKNKYGEINSWLPLDFSAGDLAGWFDKQYQAYLQRTGAVEIPAASTKLESGEALNPAPAIGENNGTSVDQQSTAPLEGMAAEPVRGTAGVQSVADGSGSGSEGRGRGTQNADGRRDAPGRSGGNRSSEVDTAAAGNTGRTGRGTGSGSDAGTTNGNLGKDQPGTGKVGYVQGDLTPAAIPESNFEITDDLALGSGGQMTKYRDNVAAIKVLKTIEAERRRATAAEKKVLARYVGWGGIPNAFRNGVTGNVVADWEKEVAELEALLTPKELRAASASTRNAHYTAKEVVDFMWGVVQKMGFAGGMVLEPSVGTGNFVGLMPKDVAGDSFVTGIELDSLTARIAGALYPKSSIINTGFQKAALPSNRFKLAIGNPPFGAESLRFQYRPELNGSSIHNQFFLGSMDALEPGGIMAMVVSRYLMDAKDATSREKLAIDAELAGAIRLPGSAFKGNALTEGVTDVLFFRKRDRATAEMLREAYFKRGKQPKTKDYKELAEYNASQAELEKALRWTKTTEVADPLGGDQMVVSQYFADRPGAVVGRMERSGSMRQGGDIDVKLEKGEKLADRLNALLEKLEQQPAQTMNAEARGNIEKFHAAMGESLRLSAKGAEADAIYFDDDGDLVTVIERVGTSADETALTTIKITPDTPWSTSFSMDLDGHWFREVAKTGPDGKPVKAVDANGKTTKRNVYVREVFKRQSDIPKTALLGKNKFAKMKALISLRDLLVNQIDLEVSRASAEQMENNRRELREAYEAFVAEHGFISESTNASIVSDMPDEGLLMSLETGYRPEVTEKKAQATGMAPSKASAKQAAILSRPVAIPPAVINHAETPVDALAVVMSESGSIDIKRIAELRGLDEEAATAELTSGDKPMAFKDPENGNALVEKNAYLSGNVRRKLEAARQAGLEANIKALEAVQPEPWSSDKVTARIGANWVPAQVYSEFVTHLLGEAGVVNYAKLTNAFDVVAGKDSAAATATWGTRRVPAPRLIENILNSSRIAVYDTDTDGNRIFNQTETDAANDKAKEIREEFDNWVFKDADRRAALTKLFNDIFNTRVTPQYDGSHLKFPGKVPDDIISLRRGQRNAVWRGIIDNAVLYDHAVGAGKTFTGIARVMERRRMGMSKKPAIVVPNHMVGEWAAQAYRLYPGAKILAATKKDLTAKNRRRLFAKIASGDWDMVIIPHSSFQFISISPETEERILMEELDTANAALREAQENAEPGKRFKPLSVKEAEALIEKIEKRLETARGKLGKDRLLTFEQMGIDDLSIDESHEFKNLFYSSNLTDVRGMGNKQGSNKAFDLYSKTRVIRDSGGSLAFMTGTPISNSAVELYNILRYLAPETLKESGIEHFDAFRSLYVDATAKFEPTDSGGSLKLVTRLGRSWSNMRSLMELYYSVSDVVTNDDIKRWFAEDNPGKEFPLPKVKGGDRQPVSVKPTPTQLRLLEETIAAFEGLDGIEDVKERNAERLRLMDRARKLSLHAKAVDPRLDDEPGGKLDVVADKAAAIWQKWTAEKGTQLIFLDRGVPKSKGDAKVIKEYDDLVAKLREASLNNDEEAAGKIIDKLEGYDANEIEELRLAQVSNWSGYQHIKDRLVSLGVPANEIAFIQDFEGDAAKEQLFQAVRDGAVRILIGSSPRMGAGTNVQDRLVALHHVDATWKPSDIEQREGRIIRQGNLFMLEPTNERPNPLYRPDFEVEILAYVTERTVDAKLWDLNSTKLRMINAIRYYDGAFEMDFDDEAAVGMAEIAAIASGDPLLLERFKLSTEIDNLYRAKRSHRRRVESAEDALRSARRTVENAPKEIEESKEDFKLKSDMMDAIYRDTVSRRMTMNGKEYTHSSITSARMDLENIAAGIGEDEKFSVKIDGKEYTSKGGAEEAIQQALGDAEPFVAEVGGKKFIRRSDYARALRELIGERLGPDSKIPPFDAGTIGGVPVRGEVTGSWNGWPDIFLGLEGTYSSTGRRRSIAGYRNIKPEKPTGEPIPVTVNGLRPVISEFERHVLYIRDGSEDISKRAKRAEADIPALELQVKEPFKGEGELDAKSERLSEVEAELSSRKTAQTAETDGEEGAGNIAESKASLSQADKAVYGMVAEGKSAADILKFIASASRNPFNRQVAKLLLKTGIAPKVMAGTSDGWRFNAGNDKKYAAAYNEKTDTIALFRPAAAERNFVHEAIHAATLRALGRKGLAAGQMKALFAHVQKTGKLKGMYGMSDVDEFVAEAFSNPKFQDALKQVAAPKASGALSSAWNWFVRIVRGILGLPANQENALSQALEIGLGVMRENMRLNVDLKNGNVRGMADKDTVAGTQAPTSAGDASASAGSDAVIRYNVADDGAWSVSEPSKMDDVIYALQDKQIDMKRVVQSIMATGKKIRDNFNPYLQEELFHGRAAKGVKDFLDFELRPLLKEMQAQGVDMGDFEEYLWNRHAEERNKQVAKINPDMPDGGSGIKTEDARAYLSGLSAEQKAKYESLAKRIDAMNKGSQQVLVESGLESADTVAAWNGAYQSYVPLQREDVDSGHVGTGKGFSIRGSASKRAMGSVRKVVDIIANIAMQRERNIVRAEKNRVSNALMGLAMENPNPEFWKVDQAPKERVVNNVAIYNVLDAEGNKVADFTNMAEADRMARSLGGEVEQTWGDRVQERIEPGFKNRDNVVLTRVNGKDHYIIFNERDERAMRMAQSLKNLDVDNMGRVLSVVGKATRYLASVNTQYNPVFGVINLIRDAQGALVNLTSTPLAGDQKKVLGYTVDALRGIYADIRAHRRGEKPSSNWANLFEEFQKEGGQTGYRDQYANAEARAEAIQSEIEQFKEGKAKQLTRGIFGWLSDYNETMENAVRLAAYKAGKERGLSNQQAASVAKNITVNFNRKGQMATQVGALYAFFNASVQGTARIAETLFEQHGGDFKNVRLSRKGKQIVAGGILLGSMQALLLAAAGYGDDEPPDFVRERNLILPIGDGKYLTLAMPLGFHVIPGTGRIATEFVMSGFKDPLKRMAQFGSMFAEAFNPVGNSGFSLQTITPSVVDPLAALAENKDFTGKEIYRENFNSLNPQPGHARAKDVATVWSRVISESLNWLTGGTEFKPGLISPSPDAIDYLIGQATGGVGREVSKSFQTGRAVSTGEELPIYKIPLVGRFVGDTQGQSGQSAKFYDAIKQINMHEAEYKGLIKDGRRQEAMEYMAENPAVKLMMAGNHAESTVRKLRSIKRDLVEKDAGQDQIRAIDDRITATMRAFNERAGAAI